MHSENCYLVLGKTGVGKSTLIKILSEDQSIKIGNSLNSETNISKCYNCEIDNYKYSLIDTPGYDDSNGNDTKNYAHIKQMLTSNNYKIKGIILLFSFQDSRFGESHRKGLEKIVSLIPLENFWDYVSIIFTKTFLDDEEELEEEKKNKLENFKPIFDTLISAFYKAKGIKKIPFSKIKTIFVNLKVKKTKKDMLNEITTIFKNNESLEPLFHKLVKEEKREQVMILNDKNRNIGDLFDVKFKIYSFYNQKGVKIKTISKPVEKKFIKKLEKKEYYGKFQESCSNIYQKSSVITFASFILGTSLVSFCPIASLGLLCLENIGATVNIGCFIALLGNKVIEYISNKEFNEQKVIEELIIEEDEL